MFGRVFTTKAGAAQRYPASVRAADSLFEGTQPWEAQVTEIDLEDKELFVPLSEMGGEEPDEPDASRGVACRLYNDFPTGITIVRIRGGQHSYLFTLNSGSTSDDFETTDELALSTVTGFKRRAEFRGNGWHYWYQIKVSLSAGTNNVSRFFFPNSSATDGGEVAQAGDGARGR